MSEYLPGETTADLPTLAKREALVAIEKLLAKWSDAEKTSIYWRLESERARLIQELGGRRG